MKEKINLKDEDGIKILKDKGYNLKIELDDFIVMMFMFLNLWEYIYSDSSQVINGYTMGQMIWYVLITETLWFGTRNKTLMKQFHTIYTIFNNRRNYINSFCEHSGKYMLLDNKGGYISRLTN